MKGVYLNKHKRTKSKLKRKEYSTATIRNHAIQLFNKNGTKSLLILAK